MIAAAALALVLAGPGGQPLLDGPRTSRPSGADPLHPTLEFANASGLGLTAPCACTAVTGTRGQAITFARASSATCLKGATVSGVANGDMVVCSTDQPRVMPGGDGTGRKGLFNEEARINTVLQSQKLDDPAWANITVGVAAPTITADQGIAPDGTLTADRLQIPSTIGVPGAASYRYQTTCGDGNDSGSVWFKGTSGSGSIYLGLGNGFAYKQLCSYVAGSWTRCANENRELIDGANAYIIGVSPLEGTGQLGAIDVLTWGAQCELGAFASSYIPTLGVAVARAAEGPYFVVPTGPVVTGSMASTLLFEGVNAGENAFMGLSVGAAYDRLLLFSSSGPNGNADLYGNSGVAFVNVASPVAGVPSRMVGNWANTLGTLLFAGNTASATLSAPNATTRLYIANYNNGFSRANGVISDVCFDDGSLTRCAP